VTPLAGVNFTSLWMNGFTENNSGGPSTIGLTLPSRNIGSVPAYLGAQFDWRQPLLNGGSVFGWLRTEWVHEFLPNRTIDPAFIAAPGFNFVVSGAQAPSDLARVSIGGKVALDRNVSVTGDVRADLYNTPSYSARAGLRVAW
jgi:outer membrane autotransporter protein